jgi:leucyl aminopeptidase
LLEFIKRKILKIEIVESLSNSFQILFSENETKFDLEKKQIIQKVENISDSAEFRFAGAEAVKNLKNALKIGVLSNDEVSTISISEEKYFSEVLEGILLSNYTFDKYLSEKKENPFKTLLVKKFKGSKKAVKNVQIVVGATNFTRDIVNSMPEEMYPKSVAKIGEELAKSNKLEVSRLDAEALKREKMGMFSAVGRASTNPPVLLKLAHRPKDAKKKILIIGKGLTYDSGGLSLKPAEFMKTMKSDKSGASAVLGVMKAVSELDLNVEVVGFLGLAENMVGGNAYKPDDVLTAMNGTTVEIGNTDAEGRLVLGDTLLYAQKTEKDFDYIFDIATLTGASVVGVGQFTFAVMGNNESLKNRVLKAGNESGEYSATLPFNRFLRETLKSNIADISNISNGRYGGAITAGLFLNEFINKENKDKWIHLDIAGPSFNEKSWGYNPSGASGVGVRTLVKFIESLEK